MELIDQLKTKGRLDDLTNFQMKCVITAEQGKSVTPYMIVDVEFGEMKWSNTKIFFDSENKIYEDMCDFQTFIEREIKINKVLRDEI